MVVISYLVIASVAKQSLFTLLKVFFTFNNPYVVGEVKNTTPS
ncbi:MAG: hypothetical protein WC455_01025 [Dehalococcoidia bacterium]